MIIRDAQEIVRRAERQMGDMLSANLHRRHLTPSQCAIVGAKTKEVYEKLAKERQKEHAGTAPGKGKTLEVHSPQVNRAPQSRDAAGAAVGVSGKTIDRAGKIINQGVPSLVASSGESVGELWLRRPFPPVFSEISVV